MREAKCVHSMGAGGFVPASISTTRRALLSGSGAVLLPATVGMVPAAARHPDAQLLALCACFLALQGEINGHWLDGQGAPGPGYIANEDERRAADALIKAQLDPVFDRLCRLTARTLDGVRGRAQCLLAYDLDLADELAGREREHRGRHGQMVVGLVRDLTAGVA